MKSPSEINPPYLSLKQALTQTDLNRHTVSLTVKSLLLNGVAPALLEPEAPTTGLHDARGRCWPCTLSGLKAEEAQAFYHAAATATRPVIAARSWTAWPTSWWRRERGRETLCASGRGGRMARRGGCSSP